MLIKLTRSGPNRYVQLVEACRDGATGRPKQRTVATLGRIDQLNTDLKSVISGLRMIRRSHSMPVPNVTNALSS